MRLNNLNSLSTELKNTTIFVIKKTIEIRNWIKHETQKNIHRSAYLYDKLSNTSF